MKKIVSLVALSLCFVSGAAKADEGELTCQAQERLSKLGMRNLLQFDYRERFESEVDLENRLSNQGLSSPGSAQVGNCNLQALNNEINLSIQSNRSHSMLEFEEFDRDHVKSLEKAVRKASTEEEKVSAKAKLEEAQKENIEKIKKVIDSLRASLANCEC